MFAFDGWEFTPAARITLHESVFEAGFCRSRVFGKSLEKKFEI